MFGERVRLFATRVDRERILGLDFSQCRRADMSTNLALDQEDALLVKQSLSTRGGILWGSAKRQSTGFGMSRAPIGEAY